MAVVVYEVHGIAENLLFPLQLVRIACNFARFASSIYPPKVKGRDTP
jgi:hypothetical protein